MQKLKIAIIGSREADEIFCEKAIEKYLLKHFNVIEHVISGGARGVDSIAEKVCNKLGIKVHVILPDYEKFSSKLAPLERNSEIAEQCDTVMALWNGKSTGTLDCIKKCCQKKKPILIHPIP